MNSFLSFDNRIFFWLNGLAGKNGWFDAVVIFFAAYTAYVLPVCLVLYWFYGKKKLAVRKMLTVAFGAFVLGRYVLVELIRLLIHENRPFVSGRATQLFYKGNEWSFPSGHVAAFIAIATAVCFYNRKLGIWLFALGLIVGIARVIAGVHYPVDILGGIVVGIFSGWFIYKFCRKFLEGLAVKLSKFSDKIYSHK